MPPSFIRRISASSSAVVTEGPNHHHRIRIRLSSGGLAKSRCTSATLPGLSGACGNATDGSNQRRRSQARRICSEVELYTQLDDAWVARAVRLAEERAEDPRVARGSQVVRHAQARVVVEDGRPRLPGAVDDVGGGVELVELRGVEHVECLDAELQVALAPAAEGEVLEQRYVEVREARVAQVEAVVGTAVVDTGHGEGSGVDPTLPRPVAGIAGHPEARLQAPRVAAGVGAQQPLRGVDARDVDAELDGIARGDPR